MEPCATRDPVHDFHPQIGLLAKLHPEYALPELRPNAFPTTHPLIGRTAFPDTSQVHRHRGFETQVRDSSEVRK